MLNLTRGQEDKRVSKKAIIELCHKRGGESFGVLPHGRHYRSVLALRSQSSLGGSNFLFEVYIKEENRKPLQVRARQS